MGSFYKGIYLPVLDEVGWDDELNTSLTLIADRIHSVAKTADESVVSSSTLQDDNHLFFFMQAFGVYRVTGTYIFDTNGIAGTQVKFGLSVPAGCTVRWRNSVNTVTESNVINGLDTGSLPAGSAEDRFYYLIVNDANTGNFQLRWAQAGVSAVPNFVRKYSTLEIKKIA